MDKQIAYRLLNVFLMLFWDVYMAVVACSVLGSGPRNAICLDPLLLLALSVANMLRIISHTRRALLRYRALTRLHGRLRDHQDAVSQKWAPVLAHAGCSSPQELLQFITKLQQDKDQLASTVSSLQSLLSAATNDILQEAAAATKASGSNRQLTVSRKHQAVAYELMAQAAEVMTTISPKPSADATGSSSKAAVSTSSTCSPGKAQAAPQPSTKRQAQTQTEQEEPVAEEARPKGNTVTVNTRTSSTDLPRLPSLVPPTCVRRTSDLSAGSNSGSNSGSSRVSNSSDSGMACCDVGSPNKSSNSARRNAGDCISTNISSNISTSSAKFTVDYGSSVFQQSWLKHHQASALQVLNRLHQASPPPAAAAAAGAPAPDCVKALPGVCDSQRAVELSVQYGQSLLAAERVVQHIEQRWQQQVAQGSQACSATTQDARTVRRFTQLLLPLAAAIRTHNSIVCSKGLQACVGEIIPPTNAQQRLDQLLLWADLLERRARIGSGSSNRPFFVQDQTDKYSSSSNNSSSSSKRGAPAPAPSAVAAVAVQASPPPRPARVSVAAVAVQASLPTALELRQREQLQRAQAVIRRQASEAAAQQERALGLAVMVSQQHLALGAGQGTSSRLAALLEGEQDNAESLAAQLAHTQQRASAQSARAVAAEGAAEQHRGEARVLRQQVSSLEGELDVVGAALVQAQREVAGLLRDNEALAAAAAAAQQRADEDRLGARELLEHMIGG